MPKEWFWFWGSICRWLKKEIWTQNPKTSVMEDGRRKRKWWIRIYKEAIPCTSTTSELHSIKGIVISSPNPNLFGAWHKKENELQFKMNMHVVFCQYIARWMLHLFLSWHVFSNNVMIYRYRHIMKMCVCVWQVGP